MQSNSDYSECVKAIEYNISIVKKREIERKAYENYYYNCWHNIKEEPLTFNQWYLTDDYIKFIRPLITPILRKMKLKKIEKADI